MFMMLERHSIYMDDWIDLTIGSHALVRVTNAIS